MARRRRNPSKRSQLDPATEGELGARHDNIKYLTNEIVSALISSHVLLDQILEARQSELSWVQIRKATKKAINIVLKHAQKKAR